ncbi:DEAD/DEAH box helicase [Leucobacter sp. USCH14]|uniref:DEAD/DEAH box helicase n=1 Tax=Leucobacter sp. USCH14 TaxID=3024838 RepID=UPI0030AEC1DD
MARKRSGGFKPPANYDPNRKPRRAGKPPERQRRSDAVTEGRARGDEQRGERPERELPSERSAPRSTSPIPQRLEARRTTAADAAGLSFQDLGLGGNLVRVLGELGAERPFPIQAATIPDAVVGGDVLGRARTGSGKTIAFGAGLVERLLRLKGQGAFASDPKPAQSRKQRGVRETRLATRKPKALILAPTRELALQIDRTVRPLARSVGFYTAQLVGGVPVDSQIHALERGVDIVIGTPGRVEDLVARRRLDLREVLVSVIDEADHMCDLGFLEPVQRVLRQTVRGGQRLLFSATLDASVSALVAEFLRDPAVHEAEEASAMPVEHRVLLVQRAHKDEVLAELAATPGRTMVFCRTRAYAEQVAEMLAEGGVKVTALHGNLSQARRELNLAKFTSGKASVLVATDVAARGLHVEGVDLVVQADLPDDAKVYLHRAGRTGRAGTAGNAVLLIPPSREARTRAMLAEAEVDVSFVGEVEPGFTHRLPG